MGDANRSLLPPKKKDWCPGNYQVGIFIRTPRGRSVEFIWDEAPKAVYEAALKMLPNQKTAREDMPSKIADQQPVEKDGKSVHVQRAVFVRKD